MKDLPDIVKRRLPSTPATTAGQPAWKASLENATGRKLASRDRAVFLLIDMSGSMAAESKLAGALTGAATFFDDAVGRGFDVGIIAFSDDARVILDPQGDGQACRRALASLQPGGTTNLAAAIRMAEDKLIGFRRERIICIVTDGVPDDRNAALRSAESARLRTIDIMAIGTDDADEAFLAKLVSRRDLARKVEPLALGSGIKSMALLLPAPKTPLIR